MDEHIQKKLADMEARIVQLEATTKKIEADTIDYIEYHTGEHLELNKMIIPSYHKTHPEYTASLQQIHDIVHKNSKGQDDTTN